MTVWRAPSRWTKRQIDDVGFTVSIVSRWPFPRTHVTVPPPVIARSLRINPSPRWSIVTADFEVDVLRIVAAAPGPSAERISIASTATTIPSVGYSTLRSRTISSPTFARARAALIVAASRCGPTVITRSSAGLLNTNGSNSDQVNRMKQNERRQCMRGSVTGRPTPGDARVAHWTTCGKSYATGETRVAPRRAARAARCTEPRPCAIVRTIAHDEIANARNRPKNTANISQNSGIAVTPFARFCLQARKRTYVRFAVRRGMSGPYPARTDDLLLVREAL